jgi:hypothetical protein
MKKLFRRIAYAVWVRLKNILYPLEEEFYLFDLKEGKYNKVKKKDL